MSISVVVFLTLVLVAAAPVSAQEQEQGRVRVNADNLTYEQQTDTVTATGNVEVTKGETKVTADSMTVNRKTNEVQAKGNVEILDLRGKVKAEALSLNIDDETGTITNGTVTLPQNQYTLTGKTLQKSYGQTYRIEQGSLTTCQCEDFKKADWSIKGQEINVTLRGKGEVHGGTFRVKDVPIMYIPYGIMPIHADRQSGFLFPNFGFSSKRGFVWEQPFYWAISRSQDLTITSDLETGARIGVWGEYRYAPSGETEGQLSASYFNEQIRGPATTNTPINRWSVTGVHRQRLMSDWNAYGDLFFVSDDLFLREISQQALNLPTFLGGNDADLRARRFTDSHVGVVRSWKNAIFRGETSYYQDLRQDDDYAFQSLPRLHFQGQQRFWQDRLEGGLSVEGVQFYRDRGYAGQRLDIAPSVALPFRLGNAALGSIKVVGRETVYRMDSEDEGLPPLPESGRLKGDQTRETVQMNAELGTRLFRVFDLHWGRLLQLQHVVEPQVSYLYTPFVEQQDLPLYDALDRLNRRNLLSYGVENRLIGKISPSPAARSSQEVPQPEVRELARLSVYQAYDPSRGLGEQDNHFSDLDVNARATPLSYLTLSADATYDVNRGDLTTTRLGGFVTDPRPLPPLPPTLQRLQRATALGVSYRAITDRLLKELNIYVVLRLNDYLTTAYTGRYDFNEGSFIGNRYYVRFIAPQHCWAVDLGIIDKVNPNEFEFRLFFTLVGLSSAGRAAF